MKKKESDEPLYPDNKEISLYETNQKGELEFVVKQRGNITTCYFMAWILGLINMGMGNYIKENIVREYGKTRAIVRLYDEDGLPVDIIVSKTRFECARDIPLWLVMFNKAACVMLNQNKFGNEKPQRFVGTFRINANIVEHIDWNQIAKDQSENKILPFIEGCFTRCDISWSTETVGAALVLGKQCCDEKKIKKTNRDCNTKLDFVRYCLSKNKLVVASANYRFRGISRNHTVYFSKIIEQGTDTNFPDGYIEVIESYIGVHKIEFDDLKKFGSLYAVDLPDLKKKKLDEDKNSDKEQLENTKIDKNDKNLCDNKNNNLHFETNVCYNKNVPEDVSLNEHKALIFKNKNKRERYKMDEMNEKNEEGQDDTFCLYFKNTDLDKELYINCEPNKPLKEIFDAFQEKYSFSYNKTSNQAFQFGTTQVAIYETKTPSELGMKSESQLTYCNNMFEVKDDNNSANL